MKVVIDLDTAQVTADFDADDRLIHTILATVLVAYWRDTGRHRKELVEKIQYLLDIYDDEVERETNDERG